MLVTNPAARASLTDVLNHPWMVRGFSGPPDAHLVHREPLRSDELDRQVIRGMKGFEFGSEEDIEKKLIQVIESDAYIRAVQAYERKNFGRNGHSHGRWAESLSNSTLASLDASNTNLQKPDASATLAKQKSKRFSGFDFYRRKLFSPASSPPGSPLSNSPPASQSHLSQTTITDQNRDQIDPTRGFHPLISMYYLSREKLERERVYGPGHFASSQLSVQDRKQSVDTSASPSSYSPTKAFAAATITKKDPIPAKADYNMQLPRLPAPETSHYSGMSYDATQATPSPTSPNFQAHAQPRARDAGLPIPLVKQTDVTDAVTPTADAELPRAPPASTHRRSHSLSQRPTTLLRGWGGIFGGGDATSGPNGVNSHREPPRSPGPELATFDEKPEEGEDRPREKEGEGNAEQKEESEKAREQAPTPTPTTHSVSAGATLVRKFGTLLSGRSDDTKKHGGTKRATILGGLSPRPSRDTYGTGEKDKSVNGEEPDKDAETIKLEEAAEVPKSPSPATTPKSTVSKGQSPSFGNAHRRAATILDPQGRTTRHERRSSTGASLLSSGTIGRLRRPSTGYGTHKKPLADRLFSRTDEEDEVLEKKSVPPPHTAIGQVTVNGQDGNFKEEDERHTSEKDFKPVFLKGLFRSAATHECSKISQSLTVLFFSVATTSTKAPSVIKTDVRRVLDRMQVQYRELKTGFECIHMPSIDISSVQPVHHQQISSGSSDPRPSIVKKASKLSFGVKREKGKDRERDDKDLPRRPSTAIPVGSHSGSSSFFNVPSNNIAIAEENGTVKEVNGVVPSPSSHDDQATQLPSSTVRPKGLPPIPRDLSAPSHPANPPISPMPTGEVDQELFESLGNNTLSVRFEINIVKVSILCCTFDSMHERACECCSISRYHGFLFMESSSGGPVGMGGNTRCWHDECSLNSNYD
jgi:hypothetical protein